MRYAVLGSCLSASIAIALRRLGHQPSGVLPHVRTDAFVAYMKDPEALGAPLGVISALAKEWSAGMSPQHAERLESRLRGQARGKLREFVSRLSEAHVLLVDNNYDLSATITTVTRRDGVFRFSNVNAPGGAAGVEYSDLLPLSAVGPAFEELVSCVRTINPRIEVFFFNFPTSSYEARGKAQERVARAREFGGHIPRLPGLTAFPLLQLDAEHLTSKGDRYFATSVYDAYARSVEIVSAGLDLPFPGTGEIPLGSLEQFASRALIEMDEEEEEV